VYEVVFDVKAMEFLEKAEKKLAKRIWNKIMDSKADPHHFFDKMTGRNDHKLRVGNYRVVADIRDDIERIEITLIDHRKRIYKRI